MDSHRWRKITDLFDTALERPREERARLLDEIGAEDGGLRDEVASLVRAHEEDPEFLEPQSAAPGGVGGGGMGGPLREGSDASDPFEGALVGCYRIERRIGEGGMGAVYLARREGDFEQVAALKVLRRGLDTEQILARFHTERRILAALDHPNVARLLDGGMTDDGRPYFVMEHIDGEPIDRFCESRGFSLRARIELFVTACSAVHHAHQNLVVHRDLKPSNILVSRDGRVKLLDFGIAKILDPERADPAATVTRPEARPLTPEYASPEQFLGDPITTASDVYSLGVLLYEIIAGERPLCPRTGTTDAAVRAATQAGAPPPSAAAPRWRAQIRGDLDTIVMKAMHPEPGRRYASAEALGEDLRRWLRGLPVAAHRDSAGYRIRRFVGRHRVAVPVGAAFAFLLVAFSVVTALQSRRIAAERARAESERATAEQVVQVLVDLFERSNPFVVPGGDTTTVATLIALGEEKVEALQNEPALQARLWQVLASIHTARSQYDRAREFHERVLVNERRLAADQRDAPRDTDARAGRGIDGDPDTLSTLHEIARLVQAARGDDAARPLFRESVDRMTRAFGARDSRVGKAMQDLAGTEPVPEVRARLLEAALEIHRATRPPDSLAIASATNALAGHLYVQGDYERARDLYAEVLRALEGRLPEGHPHRIAVMQNLVGAMTQTGDDEAAERGAREGLEIARRVTGPGSDAAAGFLEAIGVARTNQGRHAEAEASFREALDIFRETRGTGHWRYANELRNVGRSLALQDRYQEAARLIEEAISIYSRSGGMMAQGAATMRAQLALCLAALGRTDEALRLLREALAAGPSSRDASTSSDRTDMSVMLGAVLATTGSPEDAREAENLLSAALEARRRTLPAGHPRIAEAMCGLGEALAAQGRDAEAAPLLREGYPALARWGPADPAILRRYSATLARLNG